MVLKQKVSSRSKVCENRWLTMAVAVRFQKNVKNLSRGWEKMGGRPSIYVMPFQPHSACATVSPTVTFRKLLKQTGGIVYRLHFEPILRSIRGIVMPFTQHSRLPAHEQNVCEILLVAFDYTSGTVALGAETGHNEN